MRFQTVLLCSATLMLGQASVAQSWDLASQYQPNTNPNGAWQYGQVDSLYNFSPLAWFAGTNSYGVGAVGSVFVYRNEQPFLAYGIQPGNVSLESDWGNAAVRWTAPSTQTYAFNVAFGGTLLNSGGGFGNNFANLGKVRVNGVDIGNTSFSGNVNTWTFISYLTAGSTVDAMVMNPGFALGGNTNTNFSVEGVPEPATLIAFGVALPFLRRRVRR